MVMLRMMNDEQIACRLYQRYRKKRVLGLQEVTFDCATVKKKKQNRRPQEAKRPTMT
jgi:hypothetical protein